MSNLMSEFQVQFHIRIVINVVFSFPVLSRESGEETFYTYQAICPL